MVLLWEKFQHGSLKKWSTPFCAFFTTFTIVMTVLVLSIDLRGHHYIHFNASNILDFENLAQDSGKLVSLIRDKYLQPPNNETANNYNSSKEKPPVEIVKLFEGQKEGVYIECGAGEGSGTRWLEDVLGWRGLLVEAHPAHYALLPALRPRAHTANVCISPTPNPKHALFKLTTGSVANTTRSSVVSVPCFPLYSLLLAYNCTSPDLLVLNLFSAQLQVLKTIPFNAVSMRVVSIVNSEEEDTCCAVDIISLMTHHNYEQLSPCPSQHKICFFLSRANITAAH